MTVFHAHSKSLQIVTPKEFIVNFKAFSALSLKALNKTTRNLCQDNLPSARIEPGPF
jgi:hypothetical protein